ncbi:MAG: S8 family peptidase [Candidatus Dadabacteria bacterium]
MRKVTRLFFPFLFFLLLIHTALFAQLPAGANKKFSHSLFEAIRNKSEGDSAEITLSLTNLGILSVYYSKIRMIQKDERSNSVRIRIRIADIAELSKNTGVLFLNSYHPPKEELTTGFMDKSTNRINLLQSEYPGSDGQSITTSIKEQKVDTGDIDFKGRYVASGMEANTITSHASLMATITAGGGNSSIFSKGVAPASFITSVTFSNLLPEAASFFRQKNISVQNHSYGTIIENFYGSEAMAYDISANDNPGLVHVFSAGNSGLTTPVDGAYKGLSAMANLTGNFKMAKNVLTVAATDSFYNVESLSSAGPAFDGRIKPELVAFGQDGSSGAAALVSGTAAVLQQYYKYSHSDSLPPSQLTKAILINSADDVGRKGPDFKSGYGSLNAFAAIKTLSADTYFQGAVSANETKSFLFTVPAGAGSLKLTLVWNDIAANVNASKALVNDLDMVLKFPATGESWLPWVLSSFPNIDSLNQLPKRTKDTLNNVEQITLDNPVAGTYRIEVTGSKVTTPNQSFAIAYQSDTTKFKWSFPTGNDPMLAGNSNVVRWITSFSFAGDVEYSFNGNSWKALGHVDDISKGYIQWQTPDTNSLAMLRIKSMNGNVYTSDTFLINKPLNIKVGFNCADSFLLYWNKQTADNYQLYVLGDKYLQPVLNVKDTFAILNKNAFPWDYVSVAPKYSNKTGIRAYTLRYAAAGTACYFQTFYVQRQTPDSITFFAALGSLYGVKSISLEKSNSGSFSTIKTINNPVTYSFFFSDSSLSKGVNVYRLGLTLNNGQVLYSYLIPVYEFKEEEIIVYPNPVQQGSPINLVTSKAGRIEVSIFNENGQLLWQAPLTNLVNQMQTFPLSKGVFYLKAITDEGKISIKKIMVL